METHLILFLGAVLLICGSAGLIVLRLTNPRLCGIGWLGGSFAAGGAGAALLASLHHVSTFPRVALADGLVLLSFVLLHVAVLELDESISLFPRFGVALLTIQAASELCLMNGPNAARILDAVASLLIAAQVGQTTMRLIQSQRNTSRPSVWFSAGLLFFFMLFNLFRGFLVTFGGKVGWKLEQNGAVYIDAIYIAVAMGIAFGFFWMTTAALTHHLEMVASTDPLTRVYNRRSFLQWCEKERERTNRTGLDFSILIVDIDHFKNINDTFGHAVGDAVICAAVERMQDAVRGIDVIGRWGGEEFVVLLPGASRMAAMMVAQRLRRNVERIELSAIVSTASESMRLKGITVSVGVSGYLGNDDEIANILERADRALFEAKTSGRNRVAETV